jgi:6-phosphofructokinase 1
MKKIAFLTSGGDSPGMNACIRAIVKSCLNQNISPFAINNGFKGMIENDFHEMTYLNVNNIIQLGGTIIGSARSEEFKMKEFRNTAINNLISNQIDGLIVIGGDGTFTGATILAKEMDIPIIGVPATIDNDIFGTDFSIGYDSALNTIVDAIDKIRDTASSHDRIFFVEVMGRNSGYIALNAAIASGSESVLIPEQISDIHFLANQIKNLNKGIRGSIIVVAEGDDLGGALKILSDLKPLLPSFDLKATILGHIQRGGNPSAFDRIISTKMGVHAVELLIEGKTNLMVGIKENSIISIPIQDGINLKKNPIEENDIDLLKKMLTTN